MGKAPLALTVRVEVMADHMTKYHIEGLPFPLVLHQFSAPDHGDPHDHPWGFHSFIMKGGYTEEVFLDDGPQIRYHDEGDSFYISSDHIHRITSLNGGGECWTAILPQPGEPRTSGFYQFEDGKIYHRFWHEGEFHQWPR